MGVLEAARKCGLRVPEELSVIGYDDIEMAEYLGLTTIRQLLFESGQKSVNILLKTLECGLAEPTCEVLPTELIVRQTTTSPPI
jgi:DNA-binding LacI/PurR family transcriptional regulator